MVESRFSEFAYGYAAIREAEAEVASVFKSAGAPLLPSLVEEASLGYDAQLKHVGYALFLQFKRMQYVSRRHPSSPTWPKIGSPHYRFAVDTGEHQHQLLLALESLMAAEAGDVLYAAPAFHLWDEFDRAYLDGSVLDQSVFVAPSEFGSNVGVHRFTRDFAGAELILSDPRVPRRVAHWEEVLASAQSLAQIPRQSDSRPKLRLSDLEVNLDELVRESGRPSQRDLTVPITRRIQRLSGLLGCGLVLLIEDD